LHNKVVYRLARALRQKGGVVLRFNFRGVGLSEGAFDNGPGELEDARAALEWLRERYPAIPFSLAGFSFGSRIAIRLGSEMIPRRLIAVGCPREYHAELSVPLGRCGIPKFFIHSTHDQYASVQEMETFFAGIAQPKKLIWIEAADHFFAGALEKLEAAVSELP
jgi:hypothetical protein